MAKVIDPDLLETYQSDAQTIVVCVVITRTDAEVFRWTSHDVDLEISGDTYESQPGVELSSLVSTEGFAVDNAEIKVLEDDDITRADILAGIWNGATMEISEVDWAAVSLVKNKLKVGKLGNFKPCNGYSTVEFRDLRQAIQSEHQTVLQPTCRYKLGDAKCTKDVSAAPFTMTGTVDSVTSQYSITDAARTEAVDYFGDGYFTFTSGLNSGMTQKVKSFTSGGVFVFWNQFIFPIGSDNYTVTAGCRFRFQEDCITKFDNGINFGGEPNKKNPDTLSAPAP